MVNEFDFMLYRLASKIDFIAIKDGSFEGGIDFTEAFDILYKIGGEQIS